jgi:DNA-binding MarR family transcriptional regulator
VTETVVGGGAMSDGTSGAHRLARAVQRLSEQMDADVANAWGSLTGLQIGTLRTIARLGEVTRTDLSRELRTSRAALVPGLSRLLRDGLIDERPSGADCLLSVTAGGWGLLQRSEQGRAQWIVDAASDWSAHDMHATSHAIERLLASRDGDTS